MAMHGLLGCSEERLQSSLKGFDVVAINSSYGTSPSSIDAGEYVHAGDACPRRGKAKIDYPFVPQYARIFIVIVKAYENALAQTKQHIDTNF